MLSVAAGGTSQCRIPRCSFRSPWDFIENLDPTFRKKHIRLTSNPNKLCDKSTGSAKGLKHERRQTSFALCGVQKRYAGLFCCDSTRITAAHQVRRSEEAMDAVFVT